MMDNVLGWYDFKSAYVYRRPEGLIPDTGPEISDLLAVEHETEHIKLAGSTPFGLFQRLLQEVLDIESLPTDLRQSLLKLMDMSQLASWNTYEGDACCSQWHVLMMAYPDAVPAWKSKLRAEYLSAFEIFERVLAAVDVPASLGGSVVIAIARNALGTTVLGDATHLIRRVGSIQSIEQLGGAPDVRLDERVSAIMKDNGRQLRSALEDAVAPYLEGAGGLPFHLGAAELDWWQLGIQSELGPIVFSTVTAFLLELGLTAQSINDKSVEMLDGLAADWRGDLASLGALWPSPPRFVNAPPEALEVDSGQIDLSVPLPDRAFVDLGDDDIPAFLQKVDYPVSLLVYVMPHGAKEDPNLIRMSFELFVPRSDSVAFVGPPLSDAADDIRLWGFMKVVGFDQLQSVAESLRKDKFALLLDSIEAMPVVAPIVERAAKPVGVMPRNSRLDTWCRIVNTSLLFTDRTYLNMLFGPNDLPFIAVTSATGRFVHLSPSSPQAFESLRLLFRGSPSVIVGEWPVPFNAEWIGVLRALVAKLALRPM
jgi:hypothetical protein